MDNQRLRARVEAEWRDSILPELVEYVRIPAKSPAFDPEWAAHGHIDRALALAERFPHAQFLVTGVLGPHANAHGPNEFLELATAERLTCCVAAVLEACARRG